MPMLDDFITSIFGQQPPRASSVPKVSRPPKPIDPVETAIRAVGESRVDESDSDDYHAHRPSRRTGENYTIQVGDVSFTHYHHDYDLAAIGVWVDGVSVCHCRLKQFRGWSDDMEQTDTGNLEWSVYSDALAQHIIEATQVLLGRVLKRKTDRALADAKWELERVTKQQSVADRFAAVVIKSS